MIITSKQTHEKQIFKVEYLPDGSQVTYYRYPYSWQPEKVYIEYKGVKSDSKR